MAVGTQIEIEAKYVARRPGSFAALVQEQELAGFVLEPLSPLSVLDTYYDTPAGDLLRHGYALRVRVRGGAALATLKSLDAADGALHRRREIEAAIPPPPDGAAPLIPPGALRDALLRLTGAARLEPLCHLRQHRSPRVAYDGSRLVGVLSLDVVGYEGNGHVDVTNEVEVELAEDGHEDDLYRLDPVLRARGLEPTDRSKYERALLRLQRRPGDPLLLLPDERAALEAHQENGSPLHRRRARVVLLAAKGYAPQVIANKTGLSPSRVGHWLQSFREARLGIFEEAAERSAVLFGGPLQRPYRISELVTEGPDVPPLFSVSEEATLDDGAVRDGATTEEPMRESARFSTEITVERYREAPEPVALRPSGDGASGDGAHRLSEPPVLVEAPTPAPEMERPGDGLPPEAPSSTPTDGLEAESLDDLLAMLEGPLASTPFLSATVPSAPGGQEAVDDPFELTETPASQEVVDLEAVSEVGVELDEAPVAGGLVETTPEAAPAAEVEPSSVLRAGLPARPELRGEDPVLVAAARVLRHLHARLTEAARRLREERSADAGRRLLLVVHRIRIALELFGEHLPARPTRRLHGGLRGLARSLDALSDLHEVSARLTSVPALAADLDARRQALLKQVLLRLEGDALLEWQRRLERLLAHLDRRIETGLLASDDAEPPDDYLLDGIERPQRLLLRHCLASALWVRYEGVRAYESVIAGADAQLLHALGGACAGLQYVLGLTAGCGDGPYRRVARHLEHVEAHLAALHRTHLTAETLAAHVNDPEIAALHAREAEAEATLRDMVGALWEGLTGRPFRDELGDVAAAF
ncbi:MAG TPA: CYTH domain-containing protein [Rubricoccaceae bacterium]|nr:CYTH domain-containing protein [Rubricoccaceae bacterium]